jgi:dTDP-glucose 4,6-dehydratase
MASLKYQPQNILVTGGAGFIASHVVLLLVKKYPNYKIVNYDKLDYCSCLANLKEIETSPNYKFVKGDIQSVDLVSHILKTEQIDTILHFAAQTHVDNSFGNSLKFTETNVLGTHILLEAARVFQIKRFIHVSTDEVYGENEGDDFDEEKVLEPTNPYAATKAGAEFIVKSYHRSFGLPVIITRGNNVYGPHQYPEKLIPKFICLLQRDRPLTLHGNGSHKRTFVYVSDVAKAFDIILHQGAVGQIYNIGSNMEFSNLEIAIKLLEMFELLGQKDNYLTFVTDRVFNDKRYAINSEKLKKLGWKPETEFEVGLRETIRWYLSHSKNWPAVESALKPHP